MPKLYIRIMSYLTTVVVLSIIVGCTTGGGTVSDTEIIASWDDTAMTVADFKDKMYVRYSNESSAMKKEYEDRIKILDEYVVRALKIAEGYRLAFNEREDIQKSYNDAIERNASNLLYDDKVINSFVTGEMLHDFWEHYKYEVRCRHILITVDEDVKGKDTLEYWQRINEVYEKAKAGEEFTKLVSRYSEDTSIDRSLHGDLGFFKWGKMVDEFQEAAWKLDVGEISPPVRSRYGYHIIKLLEKRSTGLEVNTSHILVSVSRRASSAETTAAWERAKMILEEARKKGANFAQLARRYSEDKKTWVNGDVGWIPRGSMPTDYWDKALTMKIGEIDGPARSYKGYHIIKVNEIRDSERSLVDSEIRDKVKSSISRIYSDELQAVSEAYLESIHKRFETEYDQSVVKLLLRKLGDKSAPKNMNLFSSFTPDERKMAVVKNNLEDITIQHLVDMYGDHRFPPSFEDNFEWVKEMVEPILLPKYLTGIAKEEGYFDKPEVLAEGKRAIENAMLPEVEREMVYNKATPSEDDIKKYYEDNKDKFTEAPTATVYEIMVDDKQLAKDLLSRINKGEDISKLARRYSQREKSKKKGGMLGPFTRDQYGSVSRKAFELEINEIAGPIEAGKLYSIIKLTDLQPEKVKTFDEVRQQIESDLRFERQKGLKDTWVAELKKQYNVVYNERLLKRVWPLIDPLSEAQEAERKIWKEERSEIGKRASRQAKEDQIKLKLQPNTEQEFTTKDGKKVQVKIGEPRYVDKEGKEISPDESKIHLTPKGKIERKDNQKDDKGSAPKIKVKPREKSPGSK